MKKSILLIVLMVLCIPTIAFAKTDLTIMPIDYVNGDATLLESNG